MSSVVSLADISKDISINLSSLHIDNSLQLYDDFIFITLTINEVTYYIEIYNELNIRIYNDTTDYASFITDVIKSLPEIETIKIPIFVINQLIDSISEDSAGFDEASDEEYKYDFSYRCMKDFWKDVKSTATSDRVICITSFGNKYKNFETVKKTFDCSFNALHVRSSKSGLNLGKLRGTDIEIQKRVEQGKGFCSFIMDLVIRIEKHGYSNVGVFCSAGHHRSVACVELLKKFVYKNATIHHLNL
jgi:hypothetical protein